MKKRNPKTTSKIMSSIKSKGTQPEIRLGKAMWALGLRYRKHYNKIPGRPDFVFISKKLAIFCDGDFWHGNNWKIRGLKSQKEEFKNYTPYWKDKITKNIQRDREVDRKLEELGWTVLRIWESDIKYSADKQAQLVKKILDAL